MEPMKRDWASATAAWVAAARSVGSLLPGRLRLAEDPFGAELADGLIGHAARLCLRHPGLGKQVVSIGGPLRSFLLWMQLRTRALDDVLLRFGARAVARWCCSVRATIAARGALRMSSVRRRL